MPTTPDPFASLHTLEQTFQAEGAHVAASSGAAAGLSEGRSLGFRAGAAMTAELEFYHGAATSLLALSPLPVPPKALAAASRVIDACAPVSLSATGNDPALDMDAHAHHVRTLFRQMVAFAGVPSVRYDLDVRSRLADLSF